MYTSAVPDANNVPSTKITARYTYIPTVEQMPATSQQVTLKPGEIATHIASNLKYGGFMLTNVDGLGYKHQFFFIDIHLMATTKKIMD